MISPFCLLKCPDDEARSQKSEEKVTGRRAVAGLGAPKCNEGGWPSARTKNKSK